MEQISSAQDNRQQLRTFALSTSLHETFPIPPSRIALIIAAVVVVTETTIMLTLEALHPLPIPLPAILDSSILLICLAIFYLIYFRPLWDQHMQFALEVSHLSRRLMSSVEDERKRLTRELHDQLGQTLTALHLHIDTLSNTIPQTHKQQHHQLREIKGLMSQLSTEMREVTQGLHPVILDRVGLVSALQDLLDNFASLHPEISVVSGLHLDEEHESLLNESTTLSLYRICQECLNNISKHAEASEVRIELNLDEEGMLCLEVIDNGKGYTIRRIHGGKRKGRLGIGMLGIRERASELGGVLEIATSPDKGTHNRVRVPITQGTQNG